MHLYGVLLKKLGRFTEAESILLEGIDELKKQQGLLNNQSEIIINLVDIYKYIQADITTTDIKKTKYSKDSLEDLIREDFTTI
jgi:hypothetical protein